MINANSRGEQIEFDVFPKQDKSDYSYLSGIKEDGGRGSSSVNVVLSTQSIIILFICVLMLLIASFTLGVEKGSLVTARAAVENKETLPAVPEKVALPAATGENRVVTENTIVEPRKIQIAATPSPAPQTAYAIQIASLKSESAARGLSETLIKKGFTASVRPSGNYLVVLAGNYASREDAQGKLKELKKTYSDCFVKKI